MLLKLTKPILIQLFILSFCFTNCNEESIKNKSCDDLNKAFEKDLTRSTSKKDTLNILTKYLDIIQSDKKCINLNLSIANAYYDCDLFENSKLSYLNVLKENKENVYALFNLSLIFFNNNQYDTAIILLSEAASYKVNNGFAIDYNEKLGPLSTMYDVPYLKINYYLGLNYYYKGDFKKAMSAFSFCISNDYNLSEVYLFRGATYYEVKKIDSACNDFKLAKQLGNIKAIEYQHKYCK